VKLINGDCLEVMKDIPDNSVDAIITDPPYGTTACKWDSIIPFDLMWTQLNRVIKPNGAIVLFGSEPFSSALRMSNIKNYKYDWVWKKNYPTGAAFSKYQPMRVIENIIIFSNKNSLYNPQMRNCAKSVKKRFKDNEISQWEAFSEHIQQTSMSHPMRYKVNPINFIDINCVLRAGGTLHPTQKPVALMEYLIKTYTNEGETVLDFTMGSGTTGVACKNLNRQFIGIELDADYFKIAEERI